MNLDKLIFSHNYNKIRQDTIEQMTKGERHYFFKYIYPDRLNNKSQWLPQLLENENVHLLYDKLAQSQMLRYCEVNEDNKDAFTKLYIHCSYANQTLYKVLINSTAVDCLMHISKTEPIFKQNIHTHLDLLSSILNQIVFCNHNTQQEARNLLEYIYNNNTVSICEHVDKTIINYVVNCIREDKHCILNWNKVKKFEKEIFKQLYGHIYLCNFFNVFGAELTQQEELKFINKVKLAKFGGGTVFWWTQLNQLEFQYPENQDYVEAMIMTKKLIG